MALKRKNADGTWSYIVAGAEGSTPTWGDITGTLSNQTDLQTALDAKSAVSVSATGTSTEEVQYITINGTEKKIAGGASGAVWGGITGTMSDQTDLNTALAGKVGTDALRDTIRDLFYPVGSHYIQIDDITPTDRFGGTWEIDTTYNGKALWVDSTKTVGTEITQALPKPVISSTFIGSAVTSGGGSSHTHTFTGSSATTGGGSAHTHTFTGSEVTSGNQSANHNHTFTGSELTTTTTGAHTHTRGTMDIQGTILKNKLHEDASASGAFSMEVTTSGVTPAGSSKDTIATMTFKASNNWTGATSSNGGHTHTFTPSGSIGNNSANHTHKVTAAGTNNKESDHTHSVTAKGSNSNESAHTHSVTAAGSVLSTVVTSSAYGDGTTVQPPAISVIVWKRTA